MAGGVHGREGMHGRRACMVGGVHGGGVCVAGDGMCGGGCVAGGLHGRGKACISDTTRYGQ